jgi:hypothetical protein
MQSKRLFYYQLHNNSFYTIDTCRLFIIHVCYHAVVLLFYIPFKSRQFYGCKLIEIVPYSFIAFANKTEFSNRKEINHCSYECQFFVRNVKVSK